ncbi:MAG TPA: helix-turn-helix domain-containing protein [Chloroflexia bacterium]|nr:helix-turn-helix domain-containing protein [Chloroflexia bacterium]
MAGPHFKFIDLPTAAELLGVTRTELLAWVDEGRIRPFSGKGQQSVFRRADVERLLAEVRADAQAEADAAAVTAAEEAEAPAEAVEGGRRRRRDPIKLMGTRLSMDSRWAEMSDQDIATWLDALEPVQYDRIRKVAGIAIERLQRVLAMMDEMQARTGR